MSERAGQHHPADGRRERLLGALTALGLLSLALLLTWNHAAWVRADTAPFLGEDSHMSLARFAAQWQHLRVALGWEAVFWPDYRAPGTGWLACLSMALLGPGAEAVRLGQAVCSGLLALGTGLLCWRAWGRTAALAGAALAGTFPAFWAQVNHLMQELPALAFLSLALALQPEPGRRRWAVSLAGAVCFGLAVLMHKKSAFALAGLSAVLGLRALWQLARHRDRARLLHLAEVLLYGSGALLVLPWLLASTEQIRETSAAVAATNTEPLGLDFVLGTLAWFKHAFLTPPQAWAVLAGLLLLPWGLRSAPPVLLPTLASLVGLLGIFRFPQMHERYWLPVVPALVLLMLLPTGLLSRLRHRAAGLLAGGLHLALVPAGLAFQLLWQWPQHLPEATVDERWGIFAVVGPTRSLDETLPWLLARPTRAGWAVAPPRPKVATTGPLAQALADHWGPLEAAERLAWVPAPGEPAEPPEVAPREVVILTAPHRAELIWAELALRDQPAVLVRTPDLGELGPLVGEGAPCPAGTDCLLVLAEGDPEHPDAAELRAAGFVEVGRAGPYRSHGRRELPAVLWARAGSGAP